MALPNPIYIGENALHQPSAIRLLAYGLTAGVPGVLGVADSSIRALETPGAFIQALPGAYMVRGKHLGGKYEGYAGKYDVAEQRAVSPTTSSGGRSDLVVLVIKDPYVSGAGSWTPPADQVNGPYADIVVIENVASTTWDIAQCAAPYNTWSAITLARITRPASTGIVQQSHITDLRSLAQLGGSRTVVIDNPPVTVPPIAQASYVQFKASAADPNYGKPSGGSDNVHNYHNADQVARTWPSAATWTVAVPDWAVEADAEVIVYNAQILTGDVYGKLWLEFGSVSTSPGTYAIDYVNVPGRHNIGYGWTFSVPSSLRGRIVTVALKFQSYYTAPGKLDAKGGTTTKLSVNWQRKPDPS